MLLTLALSIIVTAACAGSQVAAEPSSRVVLISEVKWQQLNPARGDKSPQAGTLWGDRNGAVPTGFLARFVDGFSSPPHIHNATYRAVVISGTIHNDDPDAAEMWMTAGSFWTQPKGEVHITAARYGSNMALVEIDKGPYLVLPVEDAFDSGERPINVDASNIVWVDPLGMPASTTDGPKVAYLWGKLQDGQSNGTFIKLPSGFTGKITSQGSTFHAVVIKGQPRYQVSETDSKTLEPGSYFSSQGTSVHQVSSSAGVESIIYIRTDGKYDIIPARPGN
jgi:hypothetical protein